MMLNDLLLKYNLDPQQVLALRHRPFEPELRKVLPWLAAEKPDVFNAYQQTQDEKLEKVMTQGGYVASFIGHKPGEALFIGLYSIGPFRPLTVEEYWAIPAYGVLKAYGMVGFTGATRQQVLWFDLTLTDFYSSWKGKLVVGWPPPERSWWRRAHRNDMPVLAIFEESALEAAMPTWQNLVLHWDELQLLPTRWRTAISQWRAIYYIFDQSDGKGYIGSAYGETNLLGRWLNYAARGHGDNKLLRSRNSRDFQFSILELVSPAMQPDDVIRLESTWKERLHTRAPHGLNEN